MVILNITTHEQAAAQGTLPDIDRLRLIYENGLLPPHNPDEPVMYWSSTVSSYKPNGNLWYECLWSDGTQEANSDDSLISAVLLD